MARLSVGFLAAGMLFFGTLNTITVKFQVRPAPRCCGGRVPRRSRRQPRPASAHARALSATQHAHATPTHPPPKPQDMVAVGRAEDGSAITFKHPVVQVRHLAHCARRSCQRRSATAQQRIDGIAHAAVPAVSAAAAAGSLTCPPTHAHTQSACMFVGECLCFIPYFFLRWRRQRCASKCPQSAVYVFTCCTPHGVAPESLRLHTTQCHTRVLNSITVVPLQGEAPGPGVCAATRGSEARAPRRAHLGVCAALAVRRVRHDAHERGALLYVSAAHFHLHTALPSMS